MATQMRYPPEARTPQNPRAEGVTPFGLKPAGFALVALLGAAGIVLGIVGLFVSSPIEWAGVSALVSAIGLLFAAGQFMSAVNRRVLIPGATQSSGGFAGELAFGLLAAILAIFGMASTAIYPAALSIISAGIALWAGGAAEGRVIVSALRSAGAEHQTLPRFAVLSTVLGLGAIILGIVALFGAAPVAISLVGCIVLGCGLVASVLGGRSGMLRARAGV